MTDPALLAKAQEYAERLMEEAQSWPGFNDARARILAAMKKNPDLTLREAYEQERAH